MSLHTKMEAFKSDIEQKRIVRRLNGAEVAHKLNSCLRDISTFTECVSVNYAVIAFIGSRKTGEFVVLSPIKIAAVNDCTADSRGMPLHILCC